MLTKFTFAVGLCTLITLGCSQGNAEQGKKEATIRHLSKSVEYDKKATAIINKGNEYSIMNTKDSEEMIRFLRITSEEAKQVDIGILNSEVPGWGAKFRDEYPIVIKSWRNNWERLSQYFKYPEDIRRIIYTTNTIEAVHRQFRKLTKTKGAFPNQDSLRKLLYMGTVLKHVLSETHSNKSQSGIFQVCCPLLWENHTDNQGSAAFYSQLPEIWAQ